MRKANEQVDPNSCFNKANAGEMMFVLLARDPAAPYAIRKWCKRRIKLGLNKKTDQKILEAKEAARVMEQERLTDAPRKPETETENGASPRNSSESPHGHRSGSQNPRKRVRRSQSVDKRASK